MIKLKIAIIEDDIDLLTLIGQMCIDLNYDIFEFRTYEDFIFRYSSILPNLIITDRNLPGKNGNELIKSIKKIDPTIPIIMISGSNSTENILEALNLGADDFIAKPFHAEVLAIKINKILAKHIKNQEINLTLQSEIRLVKNNEIEVFLTSIEYKIFELLFENINDFVTRDLLHQQNNSRSLDVHINKLRKKIKELNLEIETIRSSGYRLKKKNLVKQ